MMKSAKVTPLMSLDKNDLKTNTKNDKLHRIDVVALIFFNLSATFNTVKNNILPRRLEHVLGLTGLVLNWFCPI